MADNMEERLRLKEEKTRQKELLKQIETPEQKRLRRLAKKEAKERKRKEQMGWDEEYMGYTNTDNPFGDANLLKTFVWNKKLEKEGLKSLKEEEIERRNKLKLDENRRELEKVKQRRLEREREREAREEELTRIQREKEAAQFKEWEKQEDGFHLQQAKLRSKIRIQDGRAKPIDLLARYISAEEEDLMVEMHEPYIYLNGLNMQDLEDLQEDIKVYMELENGKNLDYWRDLQIIVEDELHKLRRADSSCIDHVGDRREGINAAVSADVVAVFKGKTPTQLQALYNHINHKIHCGEEGIDVGYWETLLSRLKAYMARARLRERHQENLQRKLFQLKQEQGVESGPLFPCVSTVPSTSQASVLTTTDAVIDEKKLIVPDKYDSSESSEETESTQPSQALTEELDPIKQCEDEYIANGYSPRLFTIDELEPGTFIVDAEEDTKRLEFVRQQFAGTGKVEDALTTEEKAFEREARKGMDNEEAVFSVEAPLEKTYLWSDKYRPRKPRYFNRVHTGFEWNKYNQTHYDMDNPPPKIVQGYKFNIFYPDLINKSKTPEYTLTACDDNKDFAILRFHAGPPYEDIAFKIELHAHLNGSLNQSTIKKLINLKRKENFEQVPDLPSYLKLSGKEKSLTECFHLFSLIHQVTDTPAAIYEATYDVIQDFRQDNVRYLELRSTPRAIEGKMSIEEYVQYILAAIQKYAEHDTSIIVKLLLSLDRRNPLSVAMETVKLAEKYMHSHDGILIGVDLSGNPEVGKYQNFLPALDYAKRSGLKLALHIAEVPGTDDEIKAFLSLPPDRIGHGTFLHASDSGKLTTEQLKIPIEICITSNMMCGIVQSYEDHHFNFWYKKNHPCIICTDDKGIFETSLSQEYAIAGKEFSLTCSDLWNLTYNSIDYCFADSDTKDSLRRIWNQEKTKAFSTSN